MGKSSLSLREWHFPNRKGRGPGLPVHCSSIPVNLQREEVNYMKSIIIESLVLGLLVLEAQFVKVLTSNLLLTQVQYSTKKVLYSHFLLPTVRNLTSFLVWIRCSSDLIWFFSSIYQFRRKNVLLPNVRLYGSKYFSKRFSLKMKAQEQLLMGTSTIMLCLYNKYKAWNQLDQRKVFSEKQNRRAYRSGPLIYCGPTFGIKGMDENALKLNIYRNMSSTLESIRICFRWWQMWWQVLRRKDSMEQRLQKSMKR